MRITCSKCDYVLDANIKHIIEEHTDNSLTSEKAKMTGGFLQCHRCSSPAYLFSKLPLQEGDQDWTRYVKGIFRIKSKQGDSYFPYVYLTANKKEQKPFEMQIGYYKHTKTSSGKSKLKHGHGPGGPPSLNKEDFLNVLEGLIHSKVIKPEDVLNKIKNLQQIHIEN